MLAIKKNNMFLFGLIIFISVSFILFWNYLDSNSKIFYSDITKTYYAPKSNLKIIVHSKNYVDEASDLGNGNAFVKLFQVNSKHDTVFLKTSPENIDFITYQNKKIEFECSQLQPNNLSDFLKKIGFKNLDKNEIAELRDAMTYINYGPKATFLAGQTKFILVVK